MEEKEMKEQQPVAGQGEGGESTPKAAPRRRSSRSGGGDSGQKAKAEPGSGGETEPPVAELRPKKTREVKRKPVGETHPEPAEAVKQREAETDGGSDGAPKAAPRRRAGGGGGKGGQKPKTEADNVEGNVPAVVDARSEKPAKVSAEAHTDKAGDAKQEAGTDADTVSGDTPKTAPRRRGRGGKGGQKPKSEGENTGESAAAETDARPGKTDQIKQEPRPQKRTEINPEREAARPDKGGETKQQRETGVRRDKAGETKQDRENPEKINQEREPKATPDGTDEHAPKASRRRGRGGRGGQKQRTESANEGRSAGGHQSENRGGGNHQSEGRSAGAQAPEVAQYRPGKAEEKNKELIINVTPNEITIALLEDKQLVELNKEKCKTGFAVGDIYLGKVKKIMPGLNAAFVNIGYEKDAFIHYLDLGPQFTTLHKITGQLTANKQAPKFENLKLDTPIGKKGKISGQIQSGQPIVVQIAKEAISTKGPRLTSDISLAGRHVVLIPFSNKINISQKIRSNEEKRRLKKIVDKVLPRNYGVIIRTAAMGKSDADLENDITSLVTRWESALARLRNAQPPQVLLNEMNRATTIIRDLLNGSFSSIVVDDKTMYEEIKEYIKTIAPEKEKIVKLYRGKTLIFDNYDISKQIKGLFAKYVSLKKGAYLIVEHTEAMHVVDVNSGNRAKVEDDQERTAMEVNLAAAAEIARQLRLRDMGGIIVIDFIDLHKGDNRQVLHDTMARLMASDRAKHTILPISKFGLMQITRQRVRPEAISEETETCPACGGTGTITPTVLLDQQIENRVAYFRSEKKLRYIKLRVSPYVGAFLRKGFPSKRLRWMLKYGCRIKIVSDQSTGFVETKFFDSKDNELV